jgi:hypothetical protein
MINIEGESPEIVLQSAFETNEGLESYSLRMNENLEERFLNNKLEKSKTPSTSIFINPFDSYQL